MFVCLFFFCLCVFLKTTKQKSETDPVFNKSLERGDLDFVEQLWIRLRKSIICFIVKKTGAAR